MEKKKNQTSPINLSNSTNEIIYLIDEVRRLRIKIFKFCREEKSFHVNLSEIQEEMDENLSITIIKLGELLKSDVISNTLFPKD